MTDTEPKPKEGGDPSVRRKYPQSATLRVSFKKRDIDLYHTLKRTKPSHIALSEWLRRLFRLGLSAYADDPKSRTEMKPERKWMKTEDGPQDWEPWDPTDGL